MISPWNANSSSGLVGKPSSSSFSSLNALPVELVLRGAHHARQFDIGIIVERAADELVLPAGLAFDIEDARLARLHVDQAA